METQLAVRPKASQQLATLIGMEPGAMLDTIKAQCFKCDPAKVSNEMLAAFVSVAAAMEVNPLLPGHLYAFPDGRGGIVPMMGPDGVFKKLAEHPEVDSWETTIFPEDVLVPPTHAITKIWRKGRERPLSYTAVLTEWRVNANGNWQSRTRHMLGLRSLKQCARQIIHGIPFDEDERIIMGEINVTPATTQEQEQPTRTVPPPRAKKGIAAVVQNQPEKVVEKAIDVPTTPVVEAKTEEAVAPQPSEPAKSDMAIRADAIAAVLKQSLGEPESNTPPPTAPVSRAFLKDGEEFTANVTVGNVSTIMAKIAGVPTPSVQAHVTGQFVGDVFHFGGATAEGDKITPLPLWKKGNAVQVTLIGRLNKTTGKVIPRVEKLSEASQASLAVDLE